MKESWWTALVINALTFMLIGTVIYCVELGDRVTKLEEMVINNPQEGEQQERK